MATHTQCRRAVAALTLVLVTVFSNRSHADDLERIRTESPVLSRMMTMAFDRSAAFRALAERIEQSDVIVYLTCERLDERLSGRTALASASVGVRYLRVELRCQLPDQALAAILAHELQHVVEIASTASVVDDRSFARFFSRIGFATCRSPWSEQFETMAARQAGERARWEWIHHSNVSAQAGDHAGRRASVKAD